MAGTDKHARKPLAKLTVSNIWDQTYRILKENILSRRFAANEKMLIPKLAEQLGVSRTPIRDALNRLEMEGLVRTVPKVGTFVCPILEEDVNHIMDSRLMIDLWTMERIEGMSEKEFAGEMLPIDALMAQSFAAGTEIGDLERQSGLDLQFHLAFVRMAGNGKNVDIYKSLMNVRYLNLKEPHITPEMTGHAFKQHLVIYEALRARNFASARALIKEHLAYSRQNIVNAINRNGGAI